MKSEFLQQLNEEILKLVKEKMETLMEAEREAYAKEHGVRKNGFYERSLLTRWGKQGSQDKGRELLLNLKAHRDSLRGCPSLEKEAFKEKIRGRMA